MLLVVEHDWPRPGGHDRRQAGEELRHLETGRLVWEHDGLDIHLIPSPVAEDGMVLITAACFRSSKLHAIRLADAKGNLAGSRAVAADARPRYALRAVAALVRRRPEHLLGKSNAAILSVFDARSGRPHYQLQRLSRTAGGQHLIRSVCQGRALHHQPRRDDARHPPRVALRSAGDQYAGRWVRRLAGTGGRTISTSLLGNRYLSPKRANAHAISDLTLQNDHSVCVRKPRCSSMFSILTYHSPITIAHRAYASPHDRASPARLLTRRRFGVSEGSPLAYGAAQSRQEQMENIRRRRSYAPALRVFSSVHFAAVMVLL